MNLYFHDNTLDSIWKIRIVKQHEQVANTRAQQNIVVSEQLLDK